MTGDGLLQRAREQRGVTRSDLAGRLGVGVSSISDAEHRGARATLAALARYGEAMGLRLRVVYVTETGDIIE